MLTAWSDGASPGRRADAIVVASAAQLGQVRESARWVAQRAAEAPIERGHIIVWPRPAQAPSSTTEDPCRASNRSTANARDFQTKSKLISNEPR